MFPGFEILQFMLTVDYVVEITALLKEGCIIPEWQKHELGGLRLQR